MSIHIGELTTEVVRPAAPGEPTGPATARQPRWSDLEVQRRIAAALHRQLARTATGSRHD